MAHLVKQSWGTFGASLTLTAGASGGHTFLSGPTTVLAVRNVGAAPREVTIGATANCNYGRLHDLVVEIPDDGELKVIPIGFGRDGYRFGGTCELTFDVPADFEVAVAELAAHMGVGTDAETPPALGSNQPTITITADPLAEIEMLTAVSGGVRLYGNNGRTRVAIHNAGPAARTVTIIAAQRCSYGFADDEVIVVPVGDTIMSQDLPISRFGYDVGIVYDAETGLEFGAVRQGAYAG